MKDIHVIVIGSNHHNTLGVIRALGEKGILTTLIMISRKENPFVSYSKYIKKVYKIASHDLIPETLLSRCKVEDTKPVVICCSDASSSVVDLNWEILTPFFHLPGAGEQGRITYLMNKKIMAELAIEVGMQIPQTYYGQGIKVAEIPLPCIIKPLVSKEGTKADIHICYSKNEVEIIVSSIGEDKVQIQQLIDKDFEYQLIGCSTGSDVIIPGMSQILRPCKGSNTSFLRYTPMEDGFCDINRCIEFVKRTGYHGLFSLEFLRDKSGNDFFMEINFRNDGNAICVTEAGVNLPYIWALSCLGWDYQEEMKKQVKSCYVMPDWAELSLLLTRQISLTEFLSDFSKTDRFMEYDRKDPKPFWRMLKDKLFSRG